MTATETQCQLVYGREASRLTGKPAKSLVKLAARGKFLAPVKIGRQNAWPRPKLLEFLGLTTSATTNGAA